MCTASPIYIIKLFHEQQSFSVKSWLLYIIENVGHFFNIWLGKNEKQDRKRINVFKLILHVHSLFLSIKYDNKKRNKNKLHFKNFIGSLFIWTVSFSISYFFFLHNCSILINLTSTHFLFVKWCKGLIIFTNTYFNN